MEGESPRKSNFIEIAVVLRYTEYDTEAFEDRIALTDAYADPAVADSEARRLNATVSGRAVRYFVKIARLHVDELPEPEAT